MERHTINQNDVIHTLKNDISLIPGLGHSGEKVVIMEYSDTDLMMYRHKVGNCFECGYDRVKVTHKEKPEGRPIPIEYECMACGATETEDLP